jgi:Domain of unknown function (DUF1707)
VTTGPEDPTAAGRAWLRAGHADRDQVIEVLKDAFAQGRLTGDELDARAGLALTARTYADLAALTADIPLGQPPAAPARPRPPARRRLLARAAAKAGVCLLIPAAEIGVIAQFGLQPNPFWTGLIIFLAVAGLWTGLGIMGYAAFTAWDQRSSRKQLPPRSWSGGYVLEPRQRGGTGGAPVSPAPRTDQTRADLRPRKSRHYRQHLRTWADRAARGMGSAPAGV